ncbi:hypothetical protein IWX49DRAFT_587388 [Phyllosticta citricarpa]|uniref:Uncharacterized protein n=3 Tax=Phyllosticta TaxID=121621 RepID=A0ABR1MLU2_9PEZI
MASRAVKTSSWRTSRWLPQFLRKPEPERIPYNIYKNPYRAKRSWPPDLSKLSWRDQVRFDRKYRRRLKMRSTWPLWNKRVKLAQWIILGTVGFYMVCIVDWKTEIEIKAGGPVSGWSPFQVPHDFFWDNWRKVFGGKKTSNASTPEKPDESQPAA